MVSSSLSLGHNLQPTTKRQPLTFSLGYSIMIIIVIIIMIMVTIMIRLCS